MLSIFLVGGGFLACRLAGSLPARQGSLLQKDKEALQGTWTIVSARVIGQAADAQAQALLKVKVFTVRGDKTVAPGESDYAIDPTKTPKQFDMIRRGAAAGVPDLTLAGIYELQGDGLRITFSGRPGHGPLTRAARWPSCCGATEGRSEGPCGSCSSASPIANPS
jgi:uncharacterized protein (TIGR03067 family)